jgi:hypothetical protein
MRCTKTSVLRFGWVSFSVSGAFLLATLLAHAASASIVSLPLPAVEPDYWTDIVVTRVSGSYAGTVGNTGAAFSFSSTKVSGIDIGSGSALDFTFAATLSNAGPPVMNIDSTGAIVSGGLFSIALTNLNTLPASYGPVGATLLSGQITQVQFNGAGVLNMLFTNIGGTAAAHYDGYNGVGGIILNMPGVTATNFNSGPFSFTLGTADVLGRVPEPTSFLVFGLLALVTGAIADPRFR